jgi:hypothetical protein
MLKLNCSFSPFSVSWHATHSHFLPEFGHHTWLTISPPKTRLMERRKSTLLQVTLWKGPRHNHHPWDISAKNRSCTPLLKDPGDQRWVSAFTSASGEVDTPGIRVSLPCKKAFPSLRPGFQNTIQGSLGSDLGSHGSDDCVNLSEHLWKWELAESPNL